MLKGRLEKSLTVVLFVSCFYVLQCLAQGSRHGGACQDHDNNWCIRYSRWVTPHYCKNNNVVMANCEATCGNCDGGGGGDPTGWGEWDEWTQCTVTCGGGTTERTRTCQGDTGSCPGDAMESESCETQACPACQNSNSNWCKTYSRWVTPHYCKTNNIVRGNCEASCGLCDGGGGPEWGEWDEWSQCTVKCGGGTRERTRTCEGDTGSCPGDAMESESCETQACPVTGWTEWSELSECTETCGGGGTRQKTRTCPGGGDCPKGATETVNEPCEAQEDCPEWSEWDQWSQCSVTCGGGTRERTRTCEGTGSCSGSATDNESCEPQDCPEVCEDDKDYGYCLASYTVYCNLREDFANRCKKLCKRCSSPSKWGEWTEWECDVTCGTGTKTRTRVCLEGDCEGPTQQNEECVEAVCPPDTDGYGQWTEYGQCSDTCGGGIHSRTRICVSGGCTKHSEEIQNCNEQECPSDNCINDKGDEQCDKWVRWCKVHDYVKDSYCRKTCDNCPGTGPSWSDYGPCSITCKAGLKTRTKGAISQSITCLGPAQCVAGFWDPWSQWSTCSKTCGTGKQTQTRVCSVPGACTGSNMKERQCETQPCPTWGTWTTYSECSATCGPGKQSRTRSCVNGNLAECQGSGDPEYEQEINCNKKECEVAEWKEWGPWATCSKSCATGNTKRTRDCTIPGKCGTELEQSRDCNTQDCPFWANWGSWASCSASCGPGKSKRTRKCNNGPGCPGLNEGTRDCKLEDCEVAVWLPWSEWSDCTFTCGSGKRKRTRVCSKSGECDGLNEEEEDCNTEDCPMNVWSEWTEWTTCTKSCETGTQTRTRSCDHSSCPGESSQDQDCNTDDCHDVFTWTRCSKTCGGGTMRKYREKLIDGKREGLWEFKPCGNGKCTAVICSQFGSTLRNRYGPDKSKCCNNKHLPAGESCGRNERGKRIIGGKDAAEKEWPWMAAMVGGGGFCGGVIISKEWIITAAHCFADDDGRTRSGAEDYVWYTGILTITQTDDLKKYPAKEIKSVLVHKDYLYPYNDICLTKLEKPLRIDSYTYPLCLPHGEVTPEDSTCHVLGWGVSDVPDTVTNHLQELSIWNYNKGVCVESYGKSDSLKHHIPFLKNSDDYLCAGSISTDVDSCSGDSGGPILCQRCESCTWYLAGIVSFGPSPCAKKGTPGIYTKVVNYEDWIFAATGFTRHTLTCKNAP